MNQLPAMFVILMVGIICIYPRTVITSSEEINPVKRDLKLATVKFLNSLRQEICADIITNRTVREQYISKSLIGRVGPTGTFLTTEVAIEYIYGLTCAIPNLPPRDVIKEVDLLQWTFDPNYYRIAAKVQITLQSTRKYISFGILAFDKNLKACGYEAVVQNPGLAFDIPSDQHNNVIQGLCLAIQNACPSNSSFKQYEDYNDCVSFLSESSTPFGSFDRADQNNVVCRSIHVQLAQINPTVHCPHVGKTGGKACTNKTAESYFQGTTNFLKCAHKYC